MSTDVIGMLEQMAETGTAPDEGCSLFGVGYATAFSRLKEVYLEGAFQKGRSAEKFVIGPFGSGKTHFLHHLVEISRELGCATAVVALNRDIDCTQNLLIFQEIARSIRIPGQYRRGVSGLLEGCLDRVQCEFPDDPVKAKKLGEHWVEGIDQDSIFDARFASIAKRALKAKLDGEMTHFEALCRWLSGEVGDRTLAKELGTTPLAKSEHGRFGLSATLSLCQLVRRANFKGTVICFDEAEQGFSVDKRHFERIQSALQSGINATSLLSKGAVLFVYAITPDVGERLEELPSLQQRLADPGPNRGFFDGNTYAPKIDLTRRGDPAKELQGIGSSLVSLLYVHFGSELQMPKAEVLARVAREAKDIAESDAAVSNRRTMAKRTAAMLMSLKTTGSLDFLAQHHEPQECEPEV